MPPTRRELLLAADRTGFEAVHLEKVERLGDVLSAVAELPKLSSSLVLKGGTALNLFFGSPLRLSSDLDFNFIGALDREAMEQERPLLENELDRLARRLRYQTQLSRMAFAGRKMYLSYQRILDGLMDRIEIDINFLHRQPLLDLESRRMWGIA